MEFSEDRILDSNSLVIRYVYRLSRFRMFVFSMLVFLLTWLYLLLDLLQMNMAARMESTGQRNRVQISSTTAELIKAAGKANWIERRGEKIEVKGKGYQDTYWLRSDRESPPAGDKGGAQSDSEDFHAEQQDGLLSRKTERLVDWNTEVLIRRIKAILQKREKSNDAEVDMNVIRQLRQHVHAIACLYPDNPFHNFEVCNDRDIVFRSLG